MATDSFVQVAQDSNGKRIDNSEVVVGLFSVQRQRVNISDPSDANAHAAVKSSDPASGDYGQATRPIGMGVAADAKVTGDTAGTISAKLRGILSLITTTFDAALSTLATQVTLALVKAKTDNLDVALSTRALESGGNLATIAAKDFATQTTLALIKAKTDNIDVALSTRTKPADTQIATLANSTGKTSVNKTGQLTTTATTADQVVLTYTVTALKTFYLQYVDFHVRKTTLPNPLNADAYGTISLETPSGTKVITEDMVGQSGLIKFSFEFAEPIPIAEGVVIRVVCKPAAATSFLWNANFGGFEK